MNSNISIETFVLSDGFKDNYIPCIDVFYKDCYKYSIHGPIAQNNAIDAYIVAEIIKDRKLHQYGILTY